MRLLFEDFCEVTSSKRCHLSERSNDGVPFYRSKEIIQAFNGEQITDCDYIDEELYQSIDQKFGVPQTGDLLITSRGSIGIPYLYSARDRFYFADGNLTWFRNIDSRVDSRFLYYWFLSPIGKHTVDSCAKGTAQKAVAIEALKRSTVDLPDIEEQRRIASILVAYDNLIENNRRQISLLEEAAQRQYKEWFVDLRFPGYDEAEFVDGLPGGWHKESFKNFITIMSGGTPNTSNPANYDGCIPFFTPGDCGASTWVFDTAKHISEQGLKSCNSDLFSVGTTMITARGTVGKLALIGAPMAMNQSCFALKGSWLDSPYFVHFTAREKVAELKARANGGVFDAIVLRSFDDLVVTVPDEQTISLFEETAASCLKKSSLLGMQTIDLVEARDRLLLKLISGEIEVEG